MSSYNDKNSKIPDFFYKCAFKTWDMLLGKTKYTRNAFLLHNKSFTFDDNAVFF